MRTADALAWAQRQLEKAEIGTARLDALVLLEDNTTLDRTKLLANPDNEVTEAVLKKFKHQVMQRSQQIPLAYIRNKTEFYGRTFFVDKRVLEPRPESETIIEEIGSLLKEFTGPINIIDVGTGSGALIISIKLEYPKITAYATDIDQNCLDVTKLNATKFDCDITIINCDLLKEMPVAVYGSTTVIVANLPYVPDSWQINPPAMREPAKAIFGGADGLDLYRRLFSQLSKLSGPPVRLLTESMPPQHPKLAQIAEHADYIQTKDNDFIQLFSYSAKRQA